MSSNTTRTASSYIFEFPYDIAEPGGAGGWPENKGNSAEVCNIFGKKILKMEEIQSGGLLGRSHFICKFLSTHIALVPLKQIKRTENSLLVRQSIFCKGSKSKD